MWISKIVSILFAGLLLYPVARTFYEMWIFDRPAENEERPDDFPPPPGETSGPSFAVMVSETYYAVSPFERFHRFLCFGPRRWVGTVGLSATILIFVLLTYSAIFPLKGASHSYEWEDDGESISTHNEAQGAMITGGGETPSAPERKPDEQDEDDQATAAPESKP